MLTIRWTSIDEHHTKIVTNICVYCLLLVLYTDLIMSYSIMQ